MIRVLLVDDHELFRTGIRKILQEIGGMEVVGEACSGEQALAIACKQKPDVVLMDLNMPGIGGIEATRRLMRSLPDLKVIVVTVQGKDPFPNRLSEAGAAGYLTKNCDAEELMDAIRTVYAGQIYLDRSLVKQRMQADFKGKAAVSSFDELPARAMDVLIKILEGKKNQQISDELSLSPKTISTYRQRIYDKLNVKSDVELVHFALRHGLLDID